MTKLQSLVNLQNNMVNQRNSKAVLLALLKKADGPVSGESLSAHLGVSRVAVWKQIGRLEEMGYRIESSRKGYRLAEEPMDPLNAHLFQGRERFYCLEETDSTMEDAQGILHKKSQKNDNRSEDFVVTAEKQLAGRGRHNREWISAEGGLFFTHSFAAAVPSPFGYRASMAALVSLAEILREDYGQPARIKWPNDILIDNKKIVGLLAAFTGEGERICRFNLGIGINVNNAPPLPGRTCSLSSLTGKNLSRSDLMKRYLDSMNRYKNWENDALAGLYNNLSVQRGVVLLELTNREKVKGSPESVDDLGALLLDSGRRIFPGECLKTESLSQGL